MNKHHIIKMSANTSSNLELLSEKNTQTINKKSTVKHKDFNYNDFFNLLFFDSILRARIPYDYILYIVPTR